jgi:DNA polymerase-1
MDHLEKSICQLAGTVFNLNSPRQLGQILFEVLKICEAPKKTRTGQYATDEQTLMALAPDHEIVGKLLEHRTASKLKSTYADALPPSIWPPTGRVHTTFNQVATSTGRLNSQNPNLQNIPIRTERGQEIRRAFIPEAKDICCYRLTTRRSNSGSSRRSAARPGCWMPSVLGQTFILRPRRAFSEWLLKR